MSHKNLLGTLLFTLSLTIALFLPAGTLDWSIAWLYLGLRVCLSLVSTMIIASRNPALMEERFHPGEGVKSWDRILSTTTLVISFGILVLAGLDHRFRWSPALGLSVQLTALAIWLLGDAFSKWAAVSNPFYSRVVRVQEERGHAVVIEGPYKLVRHPGYAGALVAGLATPVALGSLWGLAPSGILVILVVIRTALEDQTLQAELKGYKEYAQVTHYRLLPGVW
jgi:protein-S-isoprenylcysteine O-methyltransferase Ste14